MKISKGYLATIVIALVLIADQVLKIWVKTHMYLGESIRITDWFQIFFIENNGMAFGMEIGSKLFLTVFRVVAMIAGIWYLTKIVKNRDRFQTGFIVCVALILAGTAGNIIDCVFYGQLFNNPMPPEVAVMMPEGGGYASLLHGKVVDMLYFPLFSFTWPQWLPVVGGEEFLFFQPVFNIADSAITVGIFVMLLFYSKNLAEPINPESEAESAEGSNEVKQ